MSFVSLEFLFFYPAVLLLFFLTPPHRRWMVLLPASLGFFLYFNLHDGILFFFVIGMSYLTSCLLASDSLVGAASVDPGLRLRRRIITLVGVFATLGPLFYYKYGHFITYYSSRAALKLGFGNVNILPRHVLPLGISFFTLQAVGYIIDVYRDKRDHERNFFRYSLFISFFPQLIAGPIERSSHLLGQLKEKLTVDSRSFTDGLKIFAWGVFKKVVVADNLGKVADQIFNSPREYSPAILLIGVLAFTFQIYGDFSGYTDMAIGIGRTMGVRLMQNFRHPYLSRSIPEFWQRWHLSLSTWFRDYLYIPLGGNRLGLVRWCINISVVFIVSGLWHGANLTFIVWGAIHALAYFWSAFLRRFTKNIAIPSLKLIQFGKVLCTFAAVALAWIFFRANNLSDAFYIVRTIFSGALKSQMAFSSDIFAKINFVDFRTGFGFAGILLLMEIATEFKWVGLSRFNKLPDYFKWPCYLTLIFIILIFGNFGRSRFIYFQF